MRTISLKLPEKYVEGVQDLVKSGMYPSVSEAIRVAIREFLERELETWSRRPPLRRQLTIP